MTQEYYEEYADCSGAFGAIDMFDVLAGNEDHAKHVVETAGVQEAFNRKTVDDYTTWLPMAAAEYNISPDIRDYVIVPVTIMPTDLPNRNGVGFPYRQLTRFNPETGGLAYRSWKGKPTFEEHNNKDYTKAKGINLDARLVPIEDSEGDLWKVMTLSAFDRKRDAKLGNAILTGERQCYSMGSKVRDYECSICEASLRAGGCEHVEKGKPNYRKRWRNNELAYYKCIMPCGIEVSSVGTPAYIIARTNPKHHFNFGDMPKVR